MKPGHTARPSASRTLAAGSSSGRAPTETMRSPETATSVSRGAEPRPSWTAPRRTIRSYIALSHLLVVVAGRPDAPPVTGVVQERGEEPQVGGLGGVQVLRVVLHGHQPLVVAVPL